MEKADFVLLIARSHIDELRRNAEEIGIANRVRQQQAFFVPDEDAEALCEQIRAEMHGRLYRRQAWHCWNCMRRGENGVPAGLKTASRHQYCCRAIARRAGYETA
jgi:hypothetical protein